MDTTDPDDTARAMVLERLREVRRDHGVAIPLAVESGSRAWGFPSPDSDYDCRFLYVRPSAEYLGPWPPRDVIETPLDEVLDVTGWDLIKAVRLAVKGNATVVEWLASQITYLVDEEFRRDLTRLLEGVADRSSTVQHYAHLAAGQRHRWAGTRGVPLKKAFYGLRPAAVLRWMRRHPASVVAPIALDVLLVEGEAPREVVDAARELTELKARTRELGEGAIPAALVRFVDEELALVPEPAPRLDADRARGEAADWFRAALDRYAP